MDVTSVHWRITEAWEQTLGHSDFTDEDDFFAVGGDSLRATLLVRKFERAGIAVSLADFMENPTVTALVAAALRHSDQLEQPELRRTAR